MTLLIVGSFVGWLLLVVLGLSLARAAGRDDAERALGPEARRHADGLHALGRAARR